MSALPGSLLELQIFGLPQLINQELSEGRAGPLVFYRPAGDSEVAEV